MNRDTPDILDQTIRSAQVETCAPFRHPQDFHRGTAMRTVASEKNKGVYPTLFYNISYLSLRNSQGTSREIPMFGSRSAPTTESSPSSGDHRRNLYVLGLPFDLTKSEFSKIFESYGTVTHAVILATLDSASRRRGFIVMSTHQEAKIAMDSLSRTHIKGHTLDISWAVVQRSQGFLDGADRTMMLAVSTPLISEPDTVYSPGGAEEQLSNHWELTHLPTSKLLVTNLPTILFTQISDLHPLFFPFGPIKDIKIVGSSVGHMDTTIAAMVEYVNTSNAQEAKEALQFQSYVGHPIEVHFIGDAAVIPTHTKSSPFLSGAFMGLGKSSDLGLNPFAAPFNIDARVSTMAQVYNPCFGASVPSGLPIEAPLAPQAFPAHMRPFISDAISRSSSATSSSWSHDGRPLRPSRTSHSFLGRVNAYTSYA